jgi:hypothetical protein
LECERDRQIVLRDKEHPRFNPAVLAAVQNRLQRSPPTARKKDQSGNA